ncbi:MAG: DUF6152 family protein [Gammaproteobacteria bacterium]
MRRGSNCRHHTALTGVLGLMLVQTSTAHHGFTNHFDPDREQTIEGVVTQFDFINPHVKIHLEVQLDGGATESWVAETGGSSGYLRNGRLSRDSIQPGDRILITGHPARAQEREMRANHIVLENGQELRMNNPYIEIPFLQNTDEPGN